MLEVEKSDGLAFESIFFKCLSKVFRGKLEYSRLAFTSLNLLTQGVVIDEKIYIKKSNIFRGIITGKHDVTLLAGQSHSTKNDN